MASLESARELQATMALLQRLELLKSLETEMEVLYGLQKLKQNQAPAPTCFWKAKSTSQFESTQCDRCELIQTEIVVSQGLDTVDTQPWEFGTGPCF